MAGTLRTVLRRGSMMLGPFHQIQAMKMMMERDSLKGISWATDETSMNTPNCLNLAQSCSAPGFQGHCLHGLVQKWVATLDNFFLPRFAKERPRPIYIWECVSPKVNRDTTVLSEPPF